MKAANHNCGSWSEYDPAEIRRAVEDAISRSKEYSGTQTFTTDGDKRESTRCRPCAPVRQRRRCGC